MRTIGIDSTVAGPFEVQHTTACRSPYFSETVVGWAYTVHEPIYRGVMAGDADDESDDEHGGVWVAGDGFVMVCQVPPCYRDVYQRRRDGVRRMIRSFMQHPFSCVEEVA